MMTSFCLIVPDVKARNAGVAIPEACAARDASSSTNWDRPAEVRLRRRIRSCSARAAA